MDRRDRKLYFVVSERGDSRHRILYAVDIRDGFMMLSEKMVRGRSGATPLMSEKDLRKVTLAGEQIAFCGNAEVINRTLVAAFALFSRAQHCYEREDVQPSDSRWAHETAEVLVLFKQAPGHECSFGPIELTV